MTEKEHKQNEVSLSFYRILEYIDMHSSEKLEIADLAAQTGFFDSSHFIRACKAWKGKTPKQQRFIYNR